MTRRKKFVLLGFVSVIAAVVGGIAYAAIPAGGTITGCYMKSGGNLRVIDASVTNCKATETRLQWNQQGPIGATGATGPTGAMGPTGATGTGATGAAGTASITIHQQQVSGIPPHSLSAASISCAAGQVAVAYGYNLSGLVEISGVIPIPSDGSDPFDAGEGKTPSGWLFQISNSANVDGFGDLWVTCAPGS